MKKVLLGCLLVILSLSLVGCGSKKADSKEKKDNNNENDDGNKTVEQIICKEEINNSGVSAVFTYYFTLDKDSYLSTANIYGDYTVDIDIYNSWSNKEKKMNEYINGAKDLLVKNWINEDVSEDYYKVNSSFEGNKATISILTHDSLTQKKTTKKEIMDGMNKRATCHVENITY